MHGEKLILHYFMFSSCWLTILAVVTVLMFLIQCTLRSRIIYFISYCFHFHKMYCLILFAGT